MRKTKPNQYQNKNIKEDSSIPLIQNKQTSKCFPNQTYQIRFNMLSRTNTKQSKPQSGKNSRPALNNQKGHNGIAQKQEQILKQKVNSEITIILKSIHDINECKSPLSTKQSLEKLLSFYFDKVKQILKRLKKLDNEIQRLTKQDKISKYQLKQYKNIRQTLEINAKEKAKLQKQGRAKQEQIGQLKVSIEQSKEKLCQSKNKNKKLQDEKDHLHRQIGIKDQELNREKSQIGKLKQQNIIISEEFQQQKLKYVQKTKILETKLSQQMDQNKLTLSKLQQAKDRQNQLQSQLDKIKTQNMKMQIAQNSLKVGYLTLESKVQQLQKIKADLMMQRQENIKRQAQTRHNLTKQNNPQIERQQMNGKRQKYYQNKSFFIGSVFEDENQYKHYLISALEEKLKKQIKRTKLIYSFDPLNKTNFHKYFDNRCHLVIIVKTKAEAYIAGYSEGPFFPKMVSNKNGLLFSLTNHQSYNLIEQNKRAITYDDYYMIFGNSQIRLRSGQDKIFSNFGISNSYYASKGSKINDFLCEENSREVFIQTYDIFEVHFSQ